MPTTCSENHDHYEALLNRAEMLAQSIGLGDVQDIEYQTQRLRQGLSLATPLGSFSPLLEVLEHITEKRYSQALVLLQQLLESSKAITAWHDPKIRALRAEMRLLTDEIEHLEEEKLAILKRIREFDLRYNREVGQLTLAILKIKTDCAAQIVEKDPEDHAKQQAHQKAEQEFRNFEGHCADIQKAKAFSLTQAQQDELKLLFRRASKLCHPDLVSPDLIKEATAIFRSLVDAYQQNDLETVRRILSDLETTGRSAAETSLPTEYKRLVKELRRLKEARLRLLSEIQRLKNSETFKSIAAISDLDDYFSKLKQQLQHELERLQGQAHTS